MVREHLFYEMVMAYKFSQYGMIYTNKRRKRNRNFNIAIIILPSLGLLIKEAIDLIPTTFTWRNDIVSFVMVLASLLTIVVATLKSLSPILNQPENELDKLDEISKFYGHVFVELIRLWRAFESNKLSDAETENKLDVILDKCIDKSVDLNKYFRYIGKRDNKLLEAQASESIKRAFYKPESTSNKQASSSNGES